MDHPKNYQELVTQLSTQEACLDYIASIRWRDGFVCAECGCQQFWKSKRVQWICTRCRRHTRVLAGTLFQDTKLPLTLWFPDHQESAAKDDQYDDQKDGESNIHNMLL